ncbi:MAG: hypothetical protein ACT6UT_21300 [Allorhizobium sp.]|uniref:hypothetical protein n=1 Tax=Allorhizobium sp. TaxID=633478 RepID=UPI004033BF0E
MAQPIRHWRLIAAEIVWKALRVRLCGRFFGTLRAILQQIRMGFTAHGLRLNGWRSRYGACRRFFID